MDHQRTQDEEKSTSLRARCAALVASKKSLGVVKMNELRAIFPELPWNLTWNLSPESDEAFDEDGNWIDSVMACVAVLEELSDADIRVEDDGSATRP